VGVFMDSTRYVQIPCHVCGGKSLAIGGQPRPAECVHCRYPFDGKARGGAQASGARPSDPATRSPATFARGTFAHSPVPARKPPSAAARRSPPDARKSPSASPNAHGRFREVLMRLLAHR
jgi:hypothetical protein